jgi:hypothetical protein
VEYHSDPKDMPPNGPGVLLARVFGGASLIAKISIEASDTIAATAA